MPFGQDQGTGTEGLFLEEGVTGVQVERTRDDSRQEDDDCTRGVRDLVATAERMPRRISIGGGGQPGTAISTGSTVETAPHEA